MDSFLLCGFFFGFVFKVSTTEFFHLKRIDNKCRNTGCLAEAVTINRKEMSN